MEVLLQCLNYLIASHTFSGESKAVLRNKHESLRHFHPESSDESNFFPEGFHGILKSCQALSFLSEGCTSDFSPSSPRPAVPAEVHRGLRPGLLLRHSRCIDIFGRGHHGRG